MKSKGPCVKCLWDGELPKGRREFSRWGLCIPLPTKGLLFAVNTGKEVFLFMKKHHNKQTQGRGLRNVYVLCAAAILASISFLLGFLAKIIQGTGILRLTLENLPVVLAGIVFGPAVGAAVGIGADLISCISAGQAPLPLITLGAAAVGIVSGLLGKSISLQKPRFLSVLLCEAAAQTVGSIVIKTAALSLLFPTIEGWMFALRVPIYLLIIAVESVLLYFLLRSPLVGRELKKILPKRTPTEKEEKE